ncbi:intraflagellar transport protein 22 homolog [Tachypleus tridentatus]|uniref:intraflagellar transport protein 22 homolog n=1 Tax=Tachypleus tridentatus TaxID=6853 RepID=UPI003FD5CD9A
MFKVKILAIGPCEGGKSLLCNFLAEATESSSGDYRPTQGVRILEFESDPINIGGKNVKAEVELWDCSGDQKYEVCWPALLKDANGIIFVYNPDMRNIQNEMDMWYSHFVQGQGLKDSHCVVFCRQQPGRPRGHSSQLSSLFTRVSWVQSNIEDNAEFVRQEFTTFLQRLLNNISDRRDQEELNIMNHYSRDL